MRNKLIQILFFLLGGILFNTGYGNNDSLSKFFKNLGLEVRESTSDVNHHANGVYSSIAYVLNQLFPHDERR